MKGLLLKDFYALKSTLAMVGAMLVMVFIVGLISGNDFSMVTTYFTIFAAILPFTSISLDERAGWNRYVLTTRASRNLIVASKYVMGLGLTLICIVLSAVTMLASANGEGVDLAALGMNLCFALLIQAFSLPLMLRFGSEKARILLVVISIAVSMLVILQIQSPTFLNFPLEAYLPFAAVGMLALYGLSLLVAMRIFRKKEFS